MLSLYLMLGALIGGSSAALGGLIGREQSIGVRGLLKCNGRPERNVLLKLYDDDRGLDMDEFMGSSKSDSRGAFEFSGYTSEMSPIDPKLNIYHDCNDGWMPCQRKISIMIPDSYIHPGKTPKTFYDVGTIELSGKFAGEKRDCIH
ncbi:hypothetical protein AB6A40_003886 [Gnathostoma spinigerum]|uniref:Transthyretin-like protein 5 n=1 Tax=Gnathostoma spinigerum TaxID=75299 RepID=A0ABD6EKE5_9BILA